MNEEKLVKIINELPKWSLASFIVIVLGYISFFTYCSKNRLPYIDIDIKYIIAFGLFNLITLFFLYSLTSNRKAPPIYIPLIAYVGLFLMTSSPILLAALSIIFFYSGEAIRGKLNKRKSFSELRKIAKRKELLDVMFVILYIFICMLCFLFYDMDFIIKCVVLYCISFFMYKMKKTESLNYKYGIILIIIFPIFLSYHYLDRIQYTFLGVSNSKVMIETNSGDEETGVLKFKNSTFIYLNNGENNSSRAIKVKDIKVIHFLNEEVLYKPRKTGIQFFKDLKNGEFVN